MENGKNLTFCSPKRKKNTKVVRGYAWRIADDFFFVELVFFLAQEPIFVLE